MVSNPLEPEKHFSPALRDVKRPHKLIQGPGLLYRLAGAPWCRLVNVLDVAAAEQDGGCSVAGGGFRPGERLTCCESPCLSLPRAWEQLWPWVVLPVLFFSCFMIYLLARDREIQREERDRGETERHPKP